MTTLQITPTTRNNQRISISPDQLEAALLMHRAFGTYVLHASESLQDVARSVLSPDVYFVAGAEQDLIAGGRPLDSHNSQDQGFAVGDYLYDMLSAIEWWIQLAASVISEFEEQGIEQVSARKNEIFQLIADVWAAHPAALAQTCSFRSEDVDLEPAKLLITRYRVFTRCICSCAEEVWPDINLSSLRNRD